MMANYRRRTAVAAAILIVLAVSSRAELAPTSLPGDTRLVQFEYESDNTFLILTRPNSLTHVEFGADEVIETVGAGDTANWELKPTTNRLHLFVKPKFDNLTTSMTVITSKRTYQFMLRSTNAQGKWYQRVNWRYSTLELMEFKRREDKAHADEVAKATAAQAQSNQVLATGVRPDQLRFGFAITGDAPFRPETIFDDGKFTYVRLPATVREMPAVFASVDGEMIITNYVVKEPYIVVQRVVDAGVIKLGRQEVRFERTKPTGLSRIFGSEQ
jgi:type IV secretion system protein TrbG